MSDEAGEMLVVYDDPSDHRSLSLDDTSSTAESLDETRLSLETTNDTIPYIGQRFSTHDAAYEFYSEFAKRCGFSIRRHRTEGKDGVGKGLTRRYFVCHRAGNTPIKASNESKPQRNRKSSRCGCQAYMRISKATELGGPEWRVTGFANHHNHELLEPNQVRFLPAYRTISESDKSRILMFAKTGISVQQMMRLMELEKCVEPGYLPFTEKDVRNLLQSFRKLDPEEESIDLLRMCRNIKEKDPNFKFEYTLDSNNRLENIAWSYASSIQAYDIFGDAVVFDTSHRLTVFDMPLGIWVGMNNYGMPCFFGCVLLREESLRSFSWALKVFLGFMSGKAPQTILTDQNMCLKEAISMEMPTTKHALCIWMIVAKFPSWFNAVLGERYNEWKGEFYRLYNLESIEDFELGWREMVNSFGLHSNRHIINLYGLRSLWALPFLRSHFFAGLTTIGQSKSINAFIQRFLGAQTRLAHFVEQDMSSGKMIGNAKACSGLYNFDLFPPAQVDNAFISGCISANNNDIIRWHYRLGHPSFSYLKYLFPKLFQNKDLSLLKCEICQFAKHTRAVFCSVPYKSTRPFNFIHSDIWGPSRITNTTNTKWFITFIDDHTRVSWVFLLKSKSDASMIFKNFHSGQKSIQCKSPSLTH
ncbi:protein FAR1-RELATED SEQUENCE 11 isoform X2 [Humulus lupulus]|uniref:protein FAR1-RELATED SEQUENCE 11 isoform X2 n=1 Tax=Humulus lupulus TaxID=3486 RepID=UPI002B411BD1|nr:protein FAR1-RELATED SEQUENCE 11 isoform X2 [Humulus lupulus]